MFLLFALAACSGAGGGGADNANINQQQQSPTIVGIEVTPGNAAVAIGTNVNLVATGLFSDSTTRDITSSVIWTSSEESTAKVSNAAGSAGMVTPVAAGSTKIVATSGAISGSTNLTVTPASLTSIAVTPTSQKLPVGVRKQLQAVGVFSDNSTQDLTNQVTWSSSDAAVASVEATAPQSATIKGLSPGSATITATLGGISGTSVLTVTQASILYLDLTPALPVVASGTAQQMIATGTFSDDTVEDLTGSATWTSAKAAVATVSPTGLATGITAGSTTITAAFGGVSGSTELTVGSAKLESLDLDLQYSTTSTGVPQQCTATGVFADGTMQDLTSQVTWVSSAESVASVSNASGSKGTVTSLAAGAATITATLGAVSGSTTLNVTPATLVSITANPVTARIALGTTRQFSATASGSDGTTYDITSYVSWSASDLTVASISNSAPSNGLATSVGVGSTTVTAAWRGLLSSSTLTVASATITSMTITPADVLVHLGAPQQMTAIATFTDADGVSWSQDLTAEVMWKSSSRTLATISNSAGTRGLATPLKAGTATISAVFSGAAASTTITVSSAPLTGLSITPASPTISVGDRLQMVANGTYADGYTGDLTKTVKWTSSSKKIGTIANNPTKRRGLLGGVNTGTTTITAAQQGVSGSTLVTVK